MKKAKLFISLLAVSLYSLVACSGQKQPSSVAPGDNSGEQGTSQAINPTSNGNTSQGQDPIYGDSSSNPGSNESSIPAGGSESSNPAPSSTDLVPTSIYLSKAELTLAPENSEEITATVYPEGAVYELVWTSSDSNIATVNNGLVTGVSAGTVDITATIKGTNISDKCVVTVSAAFHDYVKDGSVVLGLDYTGRDFYVDGVEQVSLLTPIDGDTAHFTTTSGVTLKARFYGIDTPESTGKVQEWGVPASNFTKEKLKNANSKGTIVVSSPQSEYGRPDPDSTGSRYVSLVWINETKKNAPLSELYLLNLWIVQEGLSLKKNVSDFPAYETSFDNAQTQAQVYKKNMWSGERDPFFNYDEGYKDISLLDIKKEVELSIKDQSHVNKYDNEKVRFTGTVSSYSDGVLYVQEFYPIDDDHPDQGEWAGINIFCGMSEISTRFTTPNTYLQVYGLCKDSETFGFQITDTQGKWKVFGATEEDCKILLKANENIDEHSLYTFNYTPAQLTTLGNNSNCESLFCSVKVTGELTCTRAFVSESSRDITLSFAETTCGVYIPFAYHGDPNSVERWDTEAHFKNKKFRLDAGTYAWHRTTSGNVKFQIIPTNESSFVCISEQQ